MKAMITATGKHDTFTCNIATYERYKEVIEAYVSGAPLQVFGGSQWMDYPFEEDLTVAYLPHLRIKQLPKPSPKIGEVWMFTEYDIPVLIINNGRILDLHSYQTMPIERLINCEEGVAYIAKDIYTYVNIIEECEEDRQKEIITAIFN